MERQLSSNLFTIRIQEIFVFDKRLDLGVEQRKRNILQGPVGTQQEKDLQVPARRSCVRPARVGYRPSAWDPRTLLKAGTKEAPSGDCSWPEKTSAPRWTRRSPPVELTPDRVLGPEESCCFCPFAHLLPDPDSLLAPWFGNPLSNSRSYCSHSPDSNAGHVVNTH